MKSAMIACALGAVCGTAGATHVVYEGAFTLQNGVLVAEGESNVEAMSAFLSELLPLYGPWTQNGAEIGAALASSGPLSLRTEPVQLDDVENFGEIGDSVNFNPLATGGVADIATGGDYIDAQLESQKETFEVAFVDVEQNVFRQDFGPVQSNQRVRGGVSSFDVSWLALNAWDTDFFATDENGRTRTFRLEFTVVPTPGGAGVLAIGALACARRRR